MLLFVSAGKLAVRLWNGFQWQAVPAEFQRDLSAATGVTHSQYTNQQIHVITKHNS